MRITDYGQSQQLLYNMQNVQQGLSQAYNALSTGQMLTNSSDDPSIVAQLFSQQSELRQNSQYTSNLQHATDVSTATYSSLSSIKDAIVSAEGLGTETTDLTNSSGFTANAAQVNTLIDQAISAANSKDNGDYLFGGDATNAAPFTVTYDASGNATGVTYTGSNNSSSFPVSDGVTLSPYSSPTQNQQLAGIINNLINLRNAMTNQDASAVQTATTAVTSDEDTAINQMSDAASVQSRITMFQNQIQQSSTATDTSISNKADTDVATATVQYNQMENAYQAAIDASAKIMTANDSLISYLASAT